MKIRDLTHKQMRELAAEGDDAYDEWLKLTEGLTFALREPVPQKQLWRLAWSKAITALLKRVDKLKPQP
jgi:hypothetical protein